MAGSTARIAWRNLGRNRRRTALSLAAIALAQMSVLLMDGLMNGWVETTTAAMTGPLMGHAQIHAPLWREEQAPDLVIEDLDARIRAIRALPEVEQAYARLYAPALVAREVDGQAAMIVGIDLPIEARPGGLIQGLPDEALPEQGSALVGATFAREAGIEVGDELAIMGTAADGSMANDLVTVSGILRTPVDLINRRGLIVPLATAQEIFVMPNQAHEINVVGHGSEHAEALVGAIGQLDGLEELETLPWRELAPEMAMILEIAGYYGIIVMFIVFIAAAAGVANTMLMATFERRREFGMLLSLGTTPMRLVRMILLEAIALGLLGVVIGSVLGGLIVLYQNHVGIDPTKLGGGDDSVEMAMYGVNFSGAIHPFLRVRDFVPGVIGIVVVAVLAAAWPAIASARLEPVKALRS